MEELYKSYGKLMIDLEILNGKIQECKREIAIGLNKFQAEPVQTKPEIVQ